MDAAERFAGSLRAAEERLRATGLHGRQAYLALVRHLAQRLELPAELVPEGPEASAGAELERIPLTAGLDLFGLAYERFFPELFKGERGQYFTPRPLVELMVRLADLGDRDRVLDPTCGSGGFLVAAMDRGASIDGIELDPELVALARLNVALHGGDPARVQPGDLFRLERSGGWSVVLANPPYSLEVRDPAGSSSRSSAASRMALTPRAAPARGGTWRTGKRSARPPSVARATCSSPAQGQTATTSSPAASPT